MDAEYVKMAKVFKAISDPKRLRIVDLLSDGEACACVLLEHFQISQPTLSHDMKLLIDVGVVKSRRDGQRVLYSLNLEMLEKVSRWLKKNITEPAGDDGEM